MYKKFGTELVYSSSDVADLSIYAARRPNGALTVMVINLAPEEKKKALRIGNQAPVQAEAWLFDPHTCRGKGWYGRFSGVGNAPFGWKMTFVTLKNDNFQLFLREALVDGRVEL